MQAIKFCRYLVPFWKREISILCLSLVSAGLGLVNPYLAKLIIDKAYAGKDLRLFVIFLATGGIIFILSGIINSLLNYLNRYINLRVNLNLNCQVFKKIQSLAYGFFQDKSTGEHLYKISYDIEQASRFITDVLPQMIKLLPQTLFILAIILYLNWQIALSTLVLMPLLYLLPYYFSRRLRQVFKIWVENSQGIFKRLQEVLSHIQIVKAFGKGRYETKEYISTLIKNIRFRLGNTRLEAAAFFSNSLANRIILGLIMFYGGYQVIRGRMTLGSFSAITIYLSQLCGLQGSLAQLFQQISLGLVSWERLEMILEAPSELRTDKSVKKSIFLQGKIEFKGITFGYEADKLVLRNLYFSIPGNCLISFVGPSGCGKTTIINLLLRLYQPLGGEILIDGYNINTLEAKCFFMQTATALQETYLWNDTLENNIKYGDSSATIQGIEEAARIADIDDFIRGLPAGYQTIIGENACKLSEGQKQRVAIARAVLNRPKILILDEALSSLDSISERKIITRIRNMPQMRTLIIISHRLSTVMASDLVYFLQGPDRITIGQPQQFLEKDVVFRDLFSAQIREPLPREITTNLYNQ